MSDPSKQRDTTGRSATSCIQNAMDKPISNRPKKCSLCRTEGHNHSNFSHKQVDGYYCFYFLILCLCLICIVHIILMYYVIFILIINFINKLFFVANNKIIYKIKLTNTTIQNY